MATKTIHAGGRRYEVIRQPDGKFAVCKRQAKYDYILDTVCFCNSITAGKRLARRLQKLDEIEGATGSRRRARNRKDT